MLEELKEILTDIVEYDSDKIDENTLLMEDMGLNSYDFMTLIGMLEEKYDFQADIDEILAMKMADGSDDSLDSVGNVIQYINKHKNS